jgi:hypothetical protein
MRPSGPAAIAICVILARPAAICAQRLPLRFAPHSITATDSAPVISPTYWVEGATIGAAVVGTTTVLLAAGLCNSSDSGSCRPGLYVGAAALGGVAGAGFGGLVGGLFRAPHSRPLRGHPVQGALIGAASGAMWGIGLLCHGAGVRCASDLTVGLSFATVGALAGWLTTR